MNIDTKMYIATTALVAAVTLGLGACSNDESASEDSSTLSAMQNKLKQASDSATDSLSGAADSATEIADNAEKSASDASDDAMDSAKDIAH